MKKSLWFALILLLICALSLSSCDKGSETPNFDPDVGFAKGLDYSINEDSKTCTITGLGSCTEEKIYIPSKIDKFKVTSIEEAAFSGEENITLVTIPDTVTVVNSRAFFGCTNLTNITIPDSVTSIGDSVFSGCTNLKSVTIPDTIKTIGSSAFEDCTNLTSITIPDSVTDIHHFAFFGCTGLTSITIPDSVTSIGMSAFANCTSLTSIIISCNLETVGNGAFSDCKSIQTATIPTVAISEISKNSLKTVIINGGTSISASAFSYCTTLNSITIPNSVTEIDAYAFSHCSNLKSITFENTNGWFCAYMPADTSGKNISSADLENNDTAINYLTKTYVNYYWRRK